MVPSDDRWKEIHRILWKGAIMRNHIKSVELCERCVYGFDRYCIERGCDECERLVDGKCKCDGIRENTPCPYFEEDENDG